MLLHLAAVALIVMVRTMREVRVGLVVGTLIVKSWWRVIGIQ